MKTVEYWVLRIADSDATWVGLNWLRPRKHQRVGFPYILTSSILLGLPGLAVGAGLIYLVLGKVESQVWFGVFLLVLLFELLLHVLFAHFWNRRAQTLIRDSSA